MHFFSASNSSSSNNRKYILLKYGLHFPQLSNVVRNLYIMAHSLVSALAWG